MYLGLRDLRVAKGRFALVGVVIVLVALLSTVLAGLANGLVDDGISGLRALPITHLSFQEGAESSFSRSILTTDQLATFDEAPGVEATPIGVSFLNAATDDGKTIDIALFGVDPGGFLAGASAAGDGATPAPSGGIEDGLVLAQDLADEVEIGERFTIAGSDLTLPVVGFTFAGTYGHVPIAYTSLDTWRQLQYGDDPRGRFAAIALRATGDADLAALDEAAGTETGTREDAFAGSPGYSAETATMSLIRGFLLVISALVVGAFFTVWTVQRTRQIGLLKALGASTGYVVRDALGQLAVILLVSVLVGTLIGLGVGSLVGEDVPFSFTAGSVVASAVALAVVGMAGSLVALRKLTGVDPVISLAAEQ
ncbi:MAG: ABC transporter permease [Acidimicrobiales bacterium]|nr:ABC transporter permease [Acidimicrobiales bacterium]